MTPNSSPPPAPGRRDGGSIRQARAIRTRMIRRRVATGAVALFLTTWVLIAVELVTGHDPALASRKTATVATSSAQTTTSTAATTAGSTTGSGSSTPTATSSGSDSSSNGSGAGTTSSVTTRQS
jgi:hypothetical protein